MSDRYAIFEKVEQREALYNFRVKLYPDEGGIFRPVEGMACSHFIFNPDGFESDFILSSSRPTVPTPEEEKIDRSRRRAKAKLNDLIMCNDFKYFVTLTLSPEAVADRTNYAEVIKKLNHFLGNRVRRKGLTYIGVAERHKLGGVHFHFLTNGVLSLEHSGTYLVDGHKKPLKESTVIRLGVDPDSCRVVYNVSDWRIGFSTAIEVDGNRQALANYIGKYLTKGEKVGGRWYLSGGDLVKPMYKYSRVDFDSFPADFEFTCPSGEFRVQYF